MENNQIELINKLRKKPIDAGPCRISQDRFKYLRKLKFTRDLTRQEIADHLAYQFYASFGYNLDWDDPVTFNEKLNWLKLNYHNPAMHECADKAAFDGYVARQLPNLDSHHVPKLAILRSIEDFTTDLYAALPEKFLVKSNFGSGAQFFADKKSVSYKELRDSMGRYFDPRTNHYYFAFEFSYKDIMPAVIIEKLIDIECKIEFFCFHGEPFIYRIVRNPGQQEGRENLYDMEGRRLDASWHYQHFEPDFRPCYFDAILEASKILSAPFPHVRVDFHAGKGTWHFNEMTFYTWAGLTPLRPYGLDVILGGKIKVDKLDPAR